MLPIWFLKINLQSILTPNRFLELLFCICAVPMFTSIFSLVENNTNLHSPSDDWH